MKRKIIPFDLEMAEKIQVGEIEGAIKMRTGNPVRLICTDLKDTQCIVAAVTREDGSEYVNVFGVSGNFITGGAFSHYDLVLEVPDTEPQFKPFDKVLVRNYDEEEWETSYFSHVKIIRDVPYYVAGNIRWEQCIQYEGNQDLVGTTDKPKEE